MTGCGWGRGNGKACCDCGWCARWRRQSCGQNRIGEITRAIRGNNSSTAADALPAAVVAGGDLKLRTSGADATTGGDSMGVIVDPKTVRGAAARAMATSPDFIADWYTAACKGDTGLRAEQKQHKRHHFTRRNTLTKRWSKNLDTNGISSLHTDHRRKVDPTALETFPNNANNYCAPQLWGVRELVHLQRDEELSERFAMSECLDHGVNETCVADVSEACAPRDHATAP